MSTIKSSAENLTLNADGANNDIKFQSNGSEVASIDQAGTVTATSFAGSGANLTGLSSFNPDGAVTINESGADVDFRVESDTLTHALFVQGSDGNVGVGITEPQKNLHIFKTEGGVGAKHASIRLGGYSTVGADISAYRIDGDSNNQGLIFSGYHSSNGTVDALTITNDGRGLSQFTAKAWFNLDGVGTVNFRDSHNCSGVSDNGTGRYTVSIDVNMANVNYSVVVSANGGAGNAYSDSWGETEKTSPAISSLAVGTFNMNSAPAGSYMDQDLTCGIVFGD